VRRTKQKSERADAIVIEWRRSKDGKKDRFHHTVTPIPLSGKNGREQGGTKGT